MRESRYRDTKEQEEYKNYVIKSLSPEMLIDIILSHPKVSLEKVDKNTGLEASYMTESLMNLYFLKIIYYDL
jgi:hypothetical protein